MYLQNTFSGGTNATAITVGNSGGASGDAFTGVSGNTTTTGAFSSTNATGARAPMASTFNTSAGSCFWDFSISGRDIYWREYLRFSSLPGVEDFCTVVKDTGGTNTIASLRVNTSGKLALRNSSGVGDVAQTTNTISSGAWFRVEVKLHVDSVAANGACEIRLYNNADSNTATEITTGTADFGTTVPVRISYTFHTGSGLDRDDVAVTDSGFIGALGSASAQPIVSFAGVQRAYSW